MYPDLQTPGSPSTHNFCFPSLWGGNTVLFQSGPRYMVLRVDPLPVGGADAVGKEAGYISALPLGSKDTVPQRLYTLLRME